MADRHNKEHSGQEMEPGRRQDGQPYAAGNTRDDGSYVVGKNRTPEHSRFGVGDGRPRGRRAKGTRNVKTEWNEELNERIVISENGRKTRQTKLRGVIKAVTARAMKGSDRAAEIVFRNAPAEERSAVLDLSEEEIIEQYLAHRSLTTKPVSDDAEEADG